MNTTIASIMHADICCVSMDDTLAEVERRLTESRLSWAPVQSADGTVLGVLSAADLTRFRAEGRDAQAFHAWQLCTWQPIGVAPDTSLEDVARQMVARHVHHVVVRQHGAMVGVVSALDFVRLFAEGGVRLEA